MLELKNISLKKMNTNTGADKVEGTTENATEKDKVLFVIHLYLLYLAFLFLFQSSYMLFS